MPVHTTSLNTLNYSENVNQLLLLLPQDEQHRTIRMRLDLFLRGKDFLPGFGEAVFCILQTMQDRNFSSFDQIIGKQDLYDLTVQMAEKLQYHKGADVIREIYSRIYPNTVFSADMNKAEKPADRREPKSVENKKKKPVSSLPPLVENDADAKEIYARLVAGGKHQILHIQQAFRVVGDYIMAEHGATTLNQLADTDAVNREIFAQLRRPGAIFAGERRNAFVAVIQALLPRKPEAVPATPPKNSPRLPSAAILPSEPA
jgi:hypothetical protein